jgi:hypothetical protein
MLGALALTLCLLTASVAAQTVPATRLDADAAQLHYDDLALDLASTPPGPEHDLFAGVLADRTSRFDDALRLLTPLASDTTLSPTRLALVLGSLADVNVKLFHYAQASALYTRLLTEDPSGLSPTLLKDDQDDADTLKLLLTAPPQTIAIDAPTPTPIDLRTHSDPLGSIAADLTIHNITAPWILDTGANFSVVSETFAHQLGLTLSTGTAHTQGATGAENPLHIAILDTLPLGSATVHNVVLLVLPDANLTIHTSRKKSYVIPAILGYPVFQALGIIRFTHDHHFQAGPTLPLTGDSSPLYMEKLNVLFSCRTHDHPRPFLFDSGANATTFFVPYYREFAADFLHEKQGTRNGYGAGGTSTDQVYILDHADLELANRVLDLQHIAVFKNPQNTLSDEYEGSLGRDLIFSLDSLTLDLVHDRVYPGKPRN